MKIQDKLITFIKNKGLNGLLLFGPDNQTYASGVVLPFANQYPERHTAFIQNQSGSRLFLVPGEWDQAVMDQNWVDPIRSYDENKSVPPTAFLDALHEILREQQLTTAKLGVDAYQIDSALLEKARGLLPQIQFVEVDKALAAMRMIKTDEEIALIEEAGVAADKGLIGAVNHLEGAVPNPGYTVAELIERIRVHIIEHGGTGIGFLSSVQADKTSLYYLPPKGKVTSQGLFRVNYTNSQNGYWFNAARMLVVGEPTRSQVKGKQDNQILKNLAVSMLKPGTSCSSIFNEVKQTADKNNIKFLSENGAGHGLGASEIEAPFLTADDETILAKGMVICLDIATFTPSGELIQSKDAYEITNEGSRLLSWYKNWDDLYIIRGFRSTH